MEKKALIFYSAIVIVGLGTMVGLVLFLRSRNAPVENSVVLQNKPAATVTQTQNLPGQQVSGKVRYATPLEKTPKAEPYKSGDPVTVQSPSIILSPDGQLEQK